MAKGNSSKKPVKRPASRANQAANKLGGIAGKGRDAIREARRRKQKELDKY